MYKMVLLLLMSSMLGQVHAKTNNATRTIWHPQFETQRLAYCDGPECGEPIANHYCELMGYDYSPKHVIAHNVGLTHSLSRERCTGWECNGFMAIACAKSLNHPTPMPYHYRKKAFAFPRFNGYRLDWCYQSQSGCGARAANAFCRHLGYLKSTRFEKAIRVKATKTIAAKELCFGDQCNGFSLIVCYR